MVGPTELVPAEKMAAKMARYWAEWMAAKMVQEKVAHLDSPMVE